jgi:ribosomal protein S18 acetylase RimI-like enzyme
MPLSEVRLSGLEAVELATRLLQRARLAGSETGLWEAADVQWWWRAARRSDDVEQHFWTDAVGPVGAVLATEFRGAWQCDPIIVAGAAIAPQVVWERAVEQAVSLQPDPVEVPARDDDRGLVAFLRAAGFVAGEPSAITWMDSHERPPVMAPAEGFVLTDRTAREGTPHPMCGRNGDAVEDRLRQCLLYDPALDLAVEAPDGAVAGYSLYWFDPVTKVGLVEPMRVNDEYRRRGLARAMLTAGVERLAQRGATRLKVGYSTDSAGALYTGSGFRLTATTTWFRADGGAGD